MPTFPQAGIITGLNADEALAKVHIPLLGIETNWIPVATGILYEVQVNFTEIGFDSPQMTDISVSSGKVSAPPMCPGIFSSLTSSQVTGSAVSSPSGAAQRVDWGTLKVGDEVLVVFLNGDINAGVVAARL